MFTEMLKGEAAEAKTDVTSDLEIKRISYWQKGQLKRTYVNGTSFTAFFVSNYY